MEVGSENSNALRAQAYEMLVSLEDVHLLARVVALVRQEYLNEILHHDANGQPVTRSMLQSSLENGLLETKAGGGVAGAEFSKRMQSRFGSGKP